MRFKKNYHISKKLKLDKINTLIENYPNKYPTPKYLLFAKKMIENGWNIKIYIANKVSKYIFITKGEEIYKIRFSNHKPLLSKEEEEDCDYYVGISNKQISTTEEIIKKIIK